MTSTRQQQLTYIISDFVMLNLGWLGFNIVRYFLLPSTYVVGLTHWLLMPPPLIGQIIVPLGIMALYWLTGYYNYSRVRIKSRIGELGNTITISLIATLIIYFTVLIDDDVPERAENYEMLLMLWSLLTLPVYMVRLLITTRTAKRIRNGKLAFNVLIVGSSPRAVALASRLDNYFNRMGMKVIGYINTDNSPTDGRNFDRPVYPFERLKELCDQLNISSLIIEPKKRKNIKSTIETLNKLYPLEKSLYLPADIYQLIISHGRLDTVVGEPLINISSARVSASTVNIKRTIDVLLSSIALLVLLPFMLMIAVAIKLDSHGPVIYRQERIGYRKRPFKINKFRTMVTDAESNGPTLSTIDDPRVTNVGKFLRKYRLDELPQFWNVLKGEMSLVGPRPERAFYLEKLISKVPYYSIVHQVRPGITSLGMVKYGYASTVEQMLQRLKYDLLYINNISIGTDLKILIHTVNTVITGKGI